MAEVESKEVAVFKQQVSSLEKKANAMKIETKEDYEEGAKVSSQLKDLGSKIKSKKESITKPLNEALKNVRNLFKPIEESFENAKETVNGKLLAYNQKVREEAAKQEAKIAADLESGKIKKLETAEKKMDNIERLDKTTHTEAGDVQVRKIKKTRITNVLLLAQYQENGQFKYLEPNLSAIRRDALGGKEIAGIEVYEEETLANII